MHFQFFKNWRTHTGLNEVLINTTFIIYFTCLNIYLFLYIYIYIYTHTHTHIQKLGSLDIEFNSNYFIILTLKFLINLDIKMPHSQKSLILSVCLLVPFHPVDITFKTISYLVCWLLVLFHSIGVIFTKLSYCSPIPNLLQRCHIH